MFTSDNFNKYSDGLELLDQMIAEKIRMPFFVQCDTQVAKQEDFIWRLAKAGCFEMFVGVESFQRQTLLSAHKAQNHPSMYGEIVKLCSKYGIMSHFSNIIGFPEDTSNSVSEHLDVLRGLQPDVASFYILTPIPGTEQYEDFRALGWITEQNLDRFDATTTTWRHPNLSAAELKEWLFRCYRKFYSVRQILRTAFDSLRPKEAKTGMLPYIGHPLFTRFSVWRNTHPMSGGIGRVHVDSSSDYRELRRKLFGLDLIPLPKSLALSAADVELNRRVKIAI
jgi:radical SAM superfamily enzyme YgiQ (UPF0313 family)